MTRENRVLFGFPNKRDFTLSQHKNFLTAAEKRIIISSFSPFDSTTFGTITWSFLSYVKNAIPLKTSFTYNTSGELTRTTFPYGAI
jgi:hypothetical protein